MLKTLKYIAIALTSAQLSTLFAFACRMFPEKMLFLITLRIATTFALFLVWKFAEDAQTKQYFAFISIGMMLGLLTGYWDELPILFNVYPFESFSLFFGVVLLLTCLVSSYVIKSSKSEA